MCDMCVICLRVLCAAFGVSVMCAGVHYRNHDHDNDNDNDHDNDFELCVRASCSWFVSAVLLRWLSWRVCCVLSVQTDR